jgi:hypothetical protein
MDWPPCPKCGHQVDQAAIDHDAAQIEQGKEMMNARTPETASGRTEAIALQGWHPSAYIYIGRPNPRYPSMKEGLFGNPFSSKAKSSALVKVESVEAAVECYRRWLEGDVAMFKLLPTTEEARRQKILAALPSLRGKRLGCWAHPGPCHGQILCELADGPLGDPRP